MRPRLAAFVLPLTLVFVACGGDDSSDQTTDGPPIDAPALAIPAACNPLGGQGCMLPFPSMSYTKAAPGTPTGIQVDIPREAMPVNADDIVFEPTTLNRWDGFSAIAPMLAMFPDTGVSAANLPSWKDPTRSLAADSPIVLLDMDTGERTAFFAEVDQNIVTVANRALIIRPLTRLHPTHRYVVAIRDTVRGADGGPLTVPEAFAAIRDGGTYNHPRFADLAARYPAIFDALATAGVQKSELVLAWDFVVASDEMLRRDLTTMRTAALPAIGTAGANLSFAATASPANGAHAHYLGTYQSPNFLTHGEAKDSVIRRDAAALPAMDGLRDAKFAAIVPKCAETHSLPLPTIIFGHGIFGSAEEYLDNGFVQDLAEDHCFVVIAGDFIGLTSREITLAPLAVNNLNRATQVTEKLAQSIIDFIALENVARGPMHAAPEFQVDGVAVIDPANTFYVGGSLGGIMGNAIMAYDPNLTKGVLAVPGGNWSLLLERSNAWSLLMGAAQSAYADDAVYQLNLVLGLGMGLEPYDPITTAAHVIKDPLFGNPVKKILMWYSLGDSLVTNLSTEMVAREMGIHVIGPSVKSPYGLIVESPPVGNGITVFDEHPTPLPSDFNIPPTEDNGTHSGINQRAAAIREVVAFLLDNTVTDGCVAPNDGPAACDCSTGACD